MSRMHHQQSNTKEGTYDCVPLYPWQKVGADLFELKEIKYLLVVDYFLLYIKIVELTSTYPGAVIAHLKTMHGLVFLRSWLVTMGLSLRLVR